MKNSKNTVDFFEKKWYNTVESVQWTVDSILDKNLTNFLHSTNYNIQLLVNNKR